ncbi:exlusion protein FxsA, partial [Vibrio cholerae]|nr:exlusion protein FxsA [Vibrio cholerae]
ELRWLQLLCLSLVLMRCQPLRRALCAKRKCESYEKQI